MSGLEEADYYWNEGVDPLDAEFLANAELHPRHGAVPHWHDDKTYDAEYGIYDEDRGVLGAVEVDLERMPDADEQPVSRVYRVRAVDAEGRIAELEWGSEVDEDWWEAGERDRDSEGNENGGLVAHIDDGRTPLDPATAGESVVGADAATSEAEGGEFVVGSEAGVARRLARWHVLVREWRWGYRDSLAALVRLVTFGE